MATMGGGDGNGDENSVNGDNGINVYNRDGNGIGGGNCNGIGDDDGDGNRWIIFLVSTSWHTLPKFNWWLLMDNYSRTL
jgi:hypothetical protein